MTSGHRIGDQRPGGLPVGEKGTRGEGQVLRLVVHVLPAADDERQRREAEHGDEDGHLHGSTSEIDRGANCSRNFRVPSGSKRWSVDSMQRKKRSRVASAK